jgi:L-amino acid N-acyltransferase
MTRLRLATAADLPAINAIYNHYVLTSTCTYDLEPITLEVRAAWFQEHDEHRYPVVVAESGGEVVGWGSLSKFRTRAGYDPTCEATVYIRHDCHRRGIGRAILIDLIAAARQAGFHTILGGASAEQTASIALQESLGFVRVAHLREVGLKFGQRLDVIFMQLML